MKNLIKKIKKLINRLYVNLLIVMYEAIYLNK